MNDLLLDISHDLAVENFDLVLTDKNNILKQRLKQELLTFKGDWFLDVEFGLPYYQEILGQRNSIESVRAVFIEAIKSVNGVAEILELELNLDAKLRELSIKFTVLDNVGNQISVEV